MDRKIMVEVTKEELELLDKEIALENMVDKFVAKLKQEKPIKVETAIDPFTREEIAVKLYGLENYTVRLIVTGSKDPEINITFKPKKKEVR